MDTALRVGNPLGLLEHRVEVLAQTSRRLFVGDDAEPGPDGAQSFELLPAGRARSDVAPDRALRGGIDIVGEIFGELFPCGITVHDRPPVPEFQVDVAEVLERPMDLGFDGPDLAPQELRDLPELQTLVAAEHQDLALLPRQAAQGPMHQGGFLLPLERQFGPGLPGGGLGEGLVEGKLVLALPQVVDVGVPGDLEHPDDEPVPPLIAGPVFQDPHEDVLDEVLARARFPVRRRKKL